jgi:hypothetical protein
MDSVHAVSYSKLNLKPENPHHFAERPLGFFVIKAQSTNNSKITKNIPSHFTEITKKIPATSFRHIFAIVTPISAILAPKFSESLPLSSYAFINTCLLHID